MALSTITVHMLVAGFIVCEVLGIEPTGWRYRLATLVPIPGVLGTVFWGHMRLWIAVPTSATCGLLLPIAYIGFLILHNRRDYMGSAKPTGLRAGLWNVGMAAAILVVGGSGIYYVSVKYIWAEGEYASPTATFRTLRRMAEAGHKARVLACFDERLQGTIRAIDKAARTDALRRPSAEAFVGTLIRKVKGATCELGRETIEGDKATLEVKLDGTTESIGLVREGGAWKIAEIGLGLPALIDTAGRIEPPLKKGEGVERPK
jgi:hypothetical protein